MKESEIPVFGLPYSNLTPESMYLYNRLRMEHTEDMDRFICIHGHFYQPPRENPWLEEIEQQDSAAPYHDWNERITAECYGANARSRLLGEEELIYKIVNNYARISFKVGPTLLKWLDDNAPDVYAAII